MSDTINIKIRKSTYDRIKNIRKWYNISNKTRKKQIDIIDDISMFYNKENNIEYLEQEIDESHIKVHDSALRSYKLSNNLLDSKKDKLEKIQSFLQKQNMKKKVTLDDAITSTMDKYLELYPQIEQEDIKTKFIKQKVLIEKIKTDYKHSNSSDI